MSRRRGGNAGNQSAIHVIRGLATGEMENTSECLRKTLAEQLQVDYLATALSTSGFMRVILTSPERANDLVGPFAISTSLSPSSPPARASEPSYRSC